MNDQHHGRTPFPSLSHLWWLLVPLGLLILLNRSVIYPNDFWWHLRTGAIILSEKHIPTTDRFSFTRAGAPWINQAWLMQIALYLIYRLGDLPLTIFIHALTTTLGYTLPLLYLGARRGIRVAALATAAGAAAGAYNWSVRPQMISFLLFGCLILLLEWEREGATWARYGVGPLFLLWGNAHGGFVFGLAALVLYLIGRTWDRGLRPWRTTLASWSMVVWALLGLSLNPQGPWGLLRYVLGFFRSKVTFAANEEFLPLTLRQGDGVLFFVTLGLWGTLLVTGRHKPRWTRVVPLLTLALAALWSRRASPWYGFLLIPALADALAAHPALTKPLPPGRVWVNRGILLLLLVALLLSLPWLRGHIPPPLAPGSLVSKTTPVEGMQVLCARADSSARVYGYQAFNAYQIWACPHLPVFIDTRIELYPPALWEDYFRLEEARFDWEEIASRYHLTHLFLSPAHQPDLVEAAQRSSHWRRVYQDDRSVLFESMGVGGGGSND